MNGIVAIYSNRGIGFNGTQPLVLAADRKHFQKITEDAAVIVGRKTLADFPGGKPLKNRHNIVLTTSTEEIDGAEIVHSVKEALEAASKFENVFVIGGTSVYEQFFDYIDCWYITLITAVPECDAFFPYLDNSWVMEECESGIENNIEYHF